MAEFKSGFFGDYSWASALAEKKLPLTPGPLNSTLNPGRIGDPFASAILNCNTQGGDWRLDKRYRQFQATPAAGTAGGIGYGETTLNEKQTYTLSVAGGAATGGTYTLTAPTEMGGATTGNIAFDATAATIRTAIEAVTGIDFGDVLITGGGSASLPVVIEMTGQYSGRNVSAWVGTGTNLTGPGSPYTISVATTIGGGNYEEYVCIQNNALYSILTSQLTNTDGSLSSAWTTLSDPGVTAGFWTFWTHGKYIFWTTEQSSQKVYYKTIGLNDALVLRELVGQAWDAQIDLAIPAYLSHPAISGTDVVTGCAVAQGTMNSETIDAAGNVVLDVSSPAGSVNDVLVTFNIAYDSTNRMNLNNNDYSGLIVDATVPFTIQQVVGVEVQDDLARLLIVPFRSEVSPLSAKIWVSLQGIPYANRDAIQVLRVRVNVAMQPGRGRMRLLPPKIGGVFLDSGQTTQPNIESPPPGRPDVQYGYRYYRNATTFSDFRKLHMNKDVALGERWSPSLPHMGAHILLTIPDIATFGFAATDRIQLFRRSSLTTERVPGAPRAWFLLSDVANSADMSFTDDKTQERMIADTPDFGDVDIPGTIATVTAREVSQVTCGCSWKGSNIFFKTNGRLYGSSPNRPFEVLWDGVVLEVNPDPAAQPRTLQIADSGLPVIGCAAQDALYMFTRKEGWAMNGDNLGTAGFPQKIKGVRGCLGRYAVTKYKDGALFASDDGVWYVEVPRYFSGEQGERELEELTQDQRPDFATLIATSPENVVVVESADDIWVMNGDDYLHSPKPLEGMQRFWIPGTWANGKSVQAAWGDPRRGIVIQFTDGTVGQIGDYLSDGGTNTAGDNGTRPTWRWDSKKFNIPVNLEAVRAYFAKTSLVSGGESISALKVLCNCEQLPLTDADAALVFDASDGVQVESWARLVAGGQTGANRWWQLRIQGAAGDVFNNVELQISAADWGRGP